MYSLTETDSPTVQIITCSRDLLLMSLEDALQADAGAFEQVLQACC